MNYDTVTPYTYILLGFIVAVIFGPWICLLISVRVAAVAAGVLTGIATVLFVIYEIESEPHAAVEIFFVPPLLLLAWLRFVRLKLRVLRASSNQIADNTGRQNQITEIADGSVPRKVLAVPEPILETAFDVVKFLLLAALVGFLILFAYLLKDIF